MIPVQSAVAQSSPDQPLVHAQRAVPVSVPQLPWLLQVIPVQSAVAQSSPDQPWSHVHAAVPVSVAQVP